MVSNLRQLARTTTQNNWKYKMYVPAEHSTCPAHNLEPEYVYARRIGSRDYKLVMECRTDDCPGWMIDVPEVTDISDSLHGLYLLGFEDSESLKRARAVRSARARAKRQELSQGTHPEQEPQAS